ncbi:hypothetical protein N7462_001790 [Penicillium macrosclerotiorum]|uniref:uncharacterized protein n=1 Tax=Penicillium macrosclerotiorum TaxID=303699 RepID=UPI002547B95E|nr:uncharacterized protein N7462_001790 [Penicillium macrosclerotiorum]KAJ5692367.1 hypothetical protein N7462_001790 [Penicillium macrosclerotiorum]
MSAPSSSFFAPQNQNVEQSWKLWESVALNLSQLPPVITTWDLWQTFDHEGKIISIDIFDNLQGNRSGRGRIRFRYVFNLFLITRYPVFYAVVSGELFCPLYTNHILCIHSPPPTSEFWRTGIYKVKIRNGHIVNIYLELVNGYQDGFIKSPVRHGVTYPWRLELSASKLDIGVRLGEFTVSPMRTIAESGCPNLVIDLRSRAFFIHFNLAIKTISKAPGGTESVSHTYRLKIPFLQLTQIWDLHDPEAEEVSYLTVLETPPVYHRKLMDIRPSFGSKTSWRDAETWYRQVTVMHFPNTQNGTTTNLRRSGQVIDTGRWNTFKIKFSIDKIGRGNFKLVSEILKDHNILMKNGNHFQEIQYRPESVWRWIDYSEFKGGSSLSMLSDLTTSDYVHLPFPLRYQLEVCLSQGRLSEFTMSREFVLKLLDLGESQARRLLEQVATEEEFYLDPMEIFKLEVLKGASDSSLPAYCCFMRTARITPTTIHYSTPTVDISNRVTRQYRELNERFLRVRFTDEKTLGGIFSAKGHSQDEVFNRIKKTLANGITIGDRHYEFLAFGNSQFREHGAYFFAPTTDLTAAHIRAWMGQFNHIRNVAKYAARLGQCFSTTRAVLGCRVRVRNIKDVIRNDYVFSDGVGRISPFLTNMIVSDFNIKTVQDRFPSAYQFRLDGCKGMLTLSSQPGPSEVQIRPSQRKFETKHGGLEIIRWSHFSAAALNRQLILVLSTLGVPDRIFHDKLNVMLDGFNKAMYNDSLATELLQKFIDPNQMTLTLAQMVFDGFRSADDPFVTSMLALWKAWHLKYLKEKAKIIIDQGATLLGVLDETRILKGYFEKEIPKGPVLYEKKVKALPEIFVQITLFEQGVVSTKVIEGVCILARNPSLHPGDIRVVHAVNRDELLHLVDVVVFPQTGDRDIPSMCSGGDLDGDDYLVIWDQSLIPTSWFTKPMEYKSRKVPKEQDHDVTVDEITSFFVTYMKQNCLPRIAHAHMAQADRLERGLYDQKCLHLAELHSVAVDYNKTGTPAVMQDELEPKIWPHFMMKRHRKSYHSRKLLGQLYDAVETIDFVPNLSKPFDKRILESALLPFSERFLDTAREVKAEYDATMRRIMAQYGIKTEFEIWSTFVLEHNYLCRDYNLHEDLGRVSSTIRSGFRQQCYDKAGGRDFECLAPLIVAMYRVTYEDTVKALKEMQSKSSKPINADELNDNSEIPSDGPILEDRKPNPFALPLISFPWIFHEFLGRIAKSQFEMDDFLADGAALTLKRNQGMFFTHKDAEQAFADLAKLDLKPSSGWEHTHISPPVNLKVTISKAISEEVDYVRPQTGGSVDSVTEKIFHVAEETPESTQTKRVGSDGLVTETGFQPSGLDQNQRVEDENVDSGVDIHEQDLFGYSEYEDYTDNDRFSDNPPTDKGKDSDLEIEQIIEVEGDIQVSAIDRLMSLVAGGL